MSENGFMDSYHNYENEFLIIADDVRQRMRQYHQQDQHHRTMTKDPMEEWMEIKHGLTQCKELLTQMSLEARSFVDDDNNTKKLSLAKVEGYRLRWELLCNQYEEIVNSHHDSVSASNNNTNNKHRVTSKLHDKKEKLHDHIITQTQTIQRAVQSMKKTELCASQLHEELDTQRTTSIKRSQIKLKDMNRLTNCARRSIQTIDRRNRFPWT